MSLANPTHGTNGRGRRPGGDALVGNLHLSYVSLLRRNTGPDSDARVTDEPTPVHGVPKLLVSWFSPLSLGLRLRGGGSISRCSTWRRTSPWRHCLRSLRCAFDGATNTAVCECSLPAVTARAMPLLDCGDPRGPEPAIAPASTMEYRRFEHQATSPPMTPKAWRRDPDCTFSTRSAMPRHVD